MGWSYLKIFFSRTAEPEEVLFTRKLSDIMTRFKFVQIMATWVRGHNMENHIYNINKLEELISTKKLPGIVQIQA
jgi:hypothetical protein